MQYVTKLHKYETANIYSVWPGGDTMSSDNHFPHDGEHGRSCTGYGCNCDEKNYGSRYGGVRNSSGGSGSGLAFLAFVVIGSIIGAFSQILGAIFIVIVGFILLINR